MTTTLTGRNQITIPAALARAYDLKPGTRIEWLAGDAEDEILCRILPDPAQAAKQLRGAGKKHLKPGDESPSRALAKERVADDLAREAAL